MYVHVAWTVTCIHVSVSSMSLPESSSALVFHLLPSRSQLKLCFRNMRAHRWKCISVTTLLDGRCLDTLSLWCLTYPSAGHHSNRALRSLEVTEICLWPRQLVSPRIQAIPQTLQTVFTHWRVPSGSASVWESSLSTGHVVRRLLSTKRNTKIHV